MNKHKNNKKNTSANYKQKSNKISKRRALKI